MKKTLIFILLLLSMSLTLAIPQDMTVQIKIMEDFETPVNYNISTNFTIYDDPIDGNILWNNIYYVKPDKGLATVTLKNIYLNFSENYYLGVNIGNDNEITPRTNLTTNPYAFKANNTDYFSGYTPTTFKSWLQNAFNSVYCKLTGCNITGDLRADNFIGNGSQLYDVNFTESDPIWESDKSNYYNKTEILDFNYYNSSDFVISDYYLNSNPSNFWNDTYAGFNKTYADTLYADISVISDNSSWNESYANTQYYSINNPYGFYNSSDFVISDYYLNSNPYGFYNTTTLQNLSQLNDNLGNRGYSHLSNFTNDLDFLDNQELINNSIADTLHRHSELVASDGSPDPALSVDASGNVGISTTSPTSNLQINGDLYSDLLRLVPNSDANDGYVEMRFYNDDNPTLNQHRYASIQGIADGTSRNNNELAFFTGTGDVARTEAMRIRDNGNVGIGTTSPDTLLDIVGGDLKLGEKTGGSQANFLEFNRLASTDSLNFVFQEADVAKAGIGLRGNTDGLSFSIGGLTAGNTKMYLDTTGNLGIGDITPTTRLEVVSSGANGISLGRDDSASGNSGRLFFDSSVEAFSIMNLQGKLQIRSDATPGTASGTERVTIDGDGDMGIGTTSPDFKLDISETGTDILRLHRDLNTNGAGFFQDFALDNSLGEITTYARINPQIVDNTDASEDGKLIFSTMRAGTITNAMTINNDGNVGIGTTSPDGKLEINSDVTSEDFISLENNGPGGRTYKINSFNTADTDQAGFEIRDNTASATRLFIDENGNIGINTTSPEVLLDLGVEGTGVLGNFALKTDSQGYAINIEEYSGTENWQIGVDADGDLNFFNSAAPGSLVSFVDGDRVGIGTTNPTTKLHVNGNFTTDGIGNFTGDVYGKSFIVQNLSSVIFGNSPANFTAKISASNLTFLNQTIDTLEVDSIFISRTNLSSTSGIGAFNQNKGNTSISQMIIGNDLSNGVSIVKTSSIWEDNYSISNPEATYVYNNYGQMKLSNRNNGSFVYSVFDEVILREGDLTFRGFVNETEIFEIFDSNAINPFQTLFNYVVNITSNLFVSGNLNVEGNITGNFYGAAIGYNSDSYITITIPASDTWTNITNLTAGKLSGFTFEDNKTLICQKAGTYNIRHIHSYEDGVGNEYNFGVAVNDVIENMTRTHSIRNNAGDIAGGSGEWLFELDVGDKINYQVLNQQTGTDIDIHQASVIIEWRGH